MAQRLLYLLTVLPGLALIAEIARRMAGLLRVAQASDPFTATTARALVTVGKLTALAGVGVWLLSQVAQGALSGTMLVSPVTFYPHQSPLGWVAVGTDLRRLRSDPRPWGGHAGRTGHRHLMPEPLPDHRISVYLDELLQAG